jgi:Holliday junction resolvase RusA-like endonuclease
VNMISFFIPAIPRGQARVRHAVRGGRSFSYKSDDQQADERTLEAMMMPFRPPNPLGGAISIQVTAVMPIPKSKPKKWQQGVKMGHIRPTGRPDLDNIGKHVIDCLTRMRFLEDDKQVCMLSLEKLYGDSPGYQIEIKQVGENING